MSTNMSHADAYVKQRSAQGMIGAVDAAAGKAARDTIQSGPTFLDETCQRLLRIREGLAAVNTRVEAVASRVIGAEPNVGEANTLAGSNEKQPPTAVVVERLLLQIESELARAHVGINRIERIG